MLVPNAGSMRGFESHLYHQDDRRHKSDFILKFFYKSADNYAILKTE